MTTYIENKNFDMKHDRGMHGPLCDFHFRDCRFDNCSLFGDPITGKRTLVRNVILERCCQRNCGIHEAILEDVVVDGLKSEGDGWFVFGAVFKHVVLRGKIDQLVLNAELSPVVSMMHEETEDVLAMETALRDANRKYYEDVDWTLDISEAELLELDLRGQPVHLIRRDPETQVLITRQSALRGDWKELPYEDDSTPFLMSLFLQREDPARILIAPKRSRKFKKILADINMLRREGIAEPD